MLLVIGGYTFWESCKSMAQKRYAKIDISNDANTISPTLRKMRLKPVIYFARSKVTISLWMILGIGLYTGIISGLLGVGGGFIIVPSLIYLVGLPSFVSVGTSLFQFIFSAAYGSIRHTMSGNVVIFASFIILFIHLSISLFEIPFILHHLDKISRVIPVLCTKSHIKLSTVPSRRVPSRPYSPRSPPKGSNLP